MNIEAKQLVRNQYVIASMILMVAVMVRILVVHQIAGSPFFNIYVADSRNYHQWALRLVAGEQDRGVFFQAPLYPYFLSVLYRVFSPDPWVPRIAQAVLAGVGCSLLAVSASRLFGHIAGWAAGLLAAFYAPALFYDMLVHKTGITLFLGSLLVFATTLFITTKRSVAAAFFIGVATGIAAMAIEHYLVVLPAVGVWMLTRFEAPRRQRLRWVGGLLAGVMLIQGPVVLRNYQVAGEPVLASTSFGLNFWVGNGEGATGHYRELLYGRGDIRFEQQDANRIAGASLGRLVTTSEASRWWFDKALHDMAARPGDWLRVMARKAGMVTGDYEWPDGDAYDAYAQESVILNAIGVFLRFGSLLVLFVIAAASVWSAKPHARLIIVASVLILASVTLFFVFGRYRYAAVPMMLVLSGASVALLQQRRNWKLALTAGIVAGAISFIPVDKMQRNPAINYYAIGVEAVNLNRLDEAKTMMLRSSELAPTEVFPYFGLATIYRRTQDWEEAEMVLRRVIRMAPNLRDAYRLLGEALVGVGDIRAKRGDAVGALRAYNEVLSTLGTDADDRQAANTRIARLAP